MPTWVCVDCNTEYEDDVNFCTDCGSERIASLDENPSPEQTRADVEWVCTECGRRHVKNSPPCNKCGSMTLEAEEPQTSIPRTTTPSNSTPRDVTAGKILSYLIGVPVALLGVSGLRLSLIGGPLLFFSGAIVTPTFRSLLEDRLNVRLHPGAIALISVACFVVSLLFFA